MLDVLSYLNNDVLFLFLFIILEILNAFGKL